MNETISVIAGQSIQDAIDKAVSGDTIFIYSGTYNENVIINKHLHITGCDKSKVTINGDGTSSPVTMIHNPLLPNALGSYLNNVTVVGGGTHSGVLIQDDGCEVSNIESNGNAHGIELDGASNCKVSSNSCTGNTGYGIYEHNGCSNNALDNNIAISNTLGGYHADGSSNMDWKNNSAIANGKGVYFKNTTGAIARETTLISNTVGIQLEGSDGNTIMDTTLSANGTAVVLINSDSNQVFNTICNASTLDISIDVNSSSNIFSHNFYETKTDLGTGNVFTVNHRTPPTEDSDNATVLHTKNWLPTTNIIYVDNKRTANYTESGSIDRPFRTIQSAVNSITGNTSTNAFVIKLLNSRYTETLTLNKDWLELTGDSCGYTVLTGAIAITSVQTRFSNLRTSGAVTLNIPNNWKLEVINCQTSPSGAWNITASAPTGNEYFQVFGGSWFAPLTVTGLYDGLFAWMMPTTISGSACIINLNHSWLQLCGGDLESCTFNLTNGTEMYVGSTFGGNVKANVGTGTTLYTDDTFHSIATIAGLGTTVRTVTASNIANDSTRTGASVKDVLDGLSFVKGTINLAGVTPVDADVATWADGSVGIGIGTGGKVFHLVKVGTAVKSVEMT
jgi:parallel beta-helix repeat protein